MQLTVVLITSAFSVIVRNFNKTLFSACFPLCMYYFGMFRDRSLLYKLYSLNSFRWITSAFSVIVRIFINCSLAFSQSYKLGPLRQCLDSRLVYKCRNTHVSRSIVNYMEKYSSTNQMYLSFLASYYIY